MTEHGHGEHGQEADQQMPQTWHYCDGIGWRTCGREDSIMLASYPWRERESNTTESEQDSSLCTS